MKTQQFRDLLVWRHAMDLARDVYRITQQFPRSEIFGLTSQLRPSAVSVPSNIAEGQGRLSDKSFALFLGQARGSLYELETQLELAYSLSYIEKKTAEKLMHDCAETGRMLNGLLKTLHNSARSGNAD